MFISTKTYGHELGFAVAYRQHLAESHCRLLHGYSLAFHIEFECETLDARNWVVDFGSLRTFKEKLEEWFDHTLLIAKDDPELGTFRNLHLAGLCKLVEVERTGCEGLAKFLYEYLRDIWLPNNGYINMDREVRVRSVEVREHGANSAIYTEPELEIPQRPRDA
ncbi:hypothetical protein LCGC14_2518670 [marine sediment metagenome]|uniref:6-pyruvoyl tetrahydrobiopterin synthase n=1 Tax=marine sediment metagenome TaxID=412755 RepID=A0A0F9D8L2_9ZZZZ